MSDETPRISVSRDALRADLAEMELRLRVYFDERLAAKANQADLSELLLRQAARERGELTPAQRIAIEEIARDTARDKAAEGWSQKERFMAVLSAAVTVGMLILSVAVATSGGGL